MLYKFKSQADSDLFMNQGPAERILAIIGKEAGPKGIIEPADMPQAIAKLEAAVAEDKKFRRERAASGETAGSAAGSGSQIVTLHQRAWPFLQLLRRSLEADKPVVWGV